MKTPVIHNTVVDKDYAVYFCISVAGTPSCVTRCRNFQMPIWNKQTEVHSNC